MDKHLTKPSLLALVADLWLEGQYGCKPSQLEVLATIASHQFGKVAATPARLGWLRSNNIRNAFQKDNSAGVKPKSRNVL